MSADSSQPSRLESVLAYAALSIIALSLLSIVASLVVGMIDRFSVAAGFWPVVYGTAFYGLPLGFVLIVVAISLGHRRRKAASREGGDPQT